MKFRELYGHSDAMFYLWNDKGITEKDYMDSTRMYKYLDKEVKRFAPVSIKYRIDGTGYEVQFGGTMSVIKVEFESD